MENQTNTFWPRVRNCVKAVLPTTTKTCIWLIKLTVAVSFAMMLLRYFDLLPYVSKLISPAFKYIGLPGTAALAYLTGYFVNCYSGMAVLVTLGLDWRAITILSTMILCSHSMIVELAVLRKTGASVPRMIIIRTLGAFLLAWVLNRILPGGSEAMADALAEPNQLPFIQLLKEWAISTVKLVLLMVVIIYALNILQRLLGEFGIMKFVAGILSPLMIFFGIPRQCAFMWLVANVVGLSYGAAAMLDEVARGGVTKRDLLLLDSHIAVCHSNVEDLILFSALGGVWWIMLLIRMALAFVLVWEHRFEFYLKDKFFAKKS